jgi:cardiolipin synthase
MTRDAAHVPHAARAAYPRRAGNSVRPLVDGEPAFRRICESVEAAEHSVWVTVAFIERDVPMPDGRGSFFDVLDAAAARGLDVRVIFWREPRFAELEPESSHFGGDAADRAWLAGRRSRFAARWDRVDGGYCQHQKSWLIDAGETTEVTFVGGINLDESSLAPPGYPPRAVDNVRDVYLELRGPSATDVHHNFVQRWNEASEREREDGIWPGTQGNDDLGFPSFASRPAGDVPVQITRTVSPGRYADQTAAPGQKPFPIAAGEESIFEQYVSAVAAAERTIYLENQALGSPIIVDELQRALVRGVHVLCVVPGNAHPAFVAARRNPRAAPFFEKLAGLGNFENFTLAAVAASRREGHYEEIYVHTKLAIVDDAWATVGSTNVAERSFHRDTELNASFWHAGAARSLRDVLFTGLLGRDTSGHDERAAYALFAQVARRNNTRRLMWEPLEGFVYALDPAQYGA